MRGNYQVRFCGGRGAAMLFSPTQHPLESKVTVLQFNEGLYEETVFTKEQKIESPTFPDLSLTVEQVLAAGKLP